MAEIPDVANNEAERRFEVRLGDDVAFAEYRLVQDGIILPHTEVPKAFEGKGVASGLARAAMAYAREHGLQVIPTCPFMAGYMQKHPETHDLVHPLFRQRLGIEAA
jgi:predicted GNAT family acetyltransferase